MVSILDENVTDKIVALEARFGLEDSTNWRDDEFTKHLVRQRAVLAGAAEAEVGDGILYGRITRFQIGEAPGGVLSLILSTCNVRDAAEVKRAAVEVGFSVID